MRRQMGNSYLPLTIVLVVLGAGLLFTALVGSQEPAGRTPLRESAAIKRANEPAAEDSKRAQPASPKSKGTTKAPAEKAPTEGKTPSKRPADAVEDFQIPRSPRTTRPESKKSEHDQADFSKSPPASGALAQQPDEGKVKGFDFGRDPLGAAKPMQTFEETMQAEVAAKPAAMQTQKQLLAGRYNLEPKLDPKLKMARGKPIPIGPTARLRKGATWDDLAAMSSADIRKANAFPYPPLPHPLQKNGGQVFPQMQIDMFPRLKRFDVDFDLPDAFLPEFPPAIFLQNRPELGDVSRGQVVSINNFRDLFKDLLTPVQLEGLRQLLMPLPQEEFNPTDDRKTDQ